MNASTSRKSHPVTAWLNSLLVLAMLGLIGWWGHTYHWQFSGKSHASGSPQSSPTGSVASDESGVLPDKPNVTVSTADHLPSIEFSSAAGAKDSGINVVPVERKSMDEVVLANGVVDYDQTKVAQLSLRVGGSVWRVEKHLGDYVERGETLAIVDSAAVGEAKANLLEACVVYRLKTQHLGRISKIKDAVAGREIIELEAATELARTQRFNAFQKLINLGFKIQLEEIETLSADELANRLHRLGLPEALSQETSSDNLIPLVSPLSGVVTKCDVVRGETVEASTPFYVVADTRRMWIQLNVRQDDANRLKIGTPVIFSGDMRTPQVTAELTWIGTEIDPRTRTIQARAEVENPPLDGEQNSTGTARLLSAGAFGTARILIQKQENVVVVPDEALHWQWEIGKEVVFVAEDAGRRFHPQVVSKGLARDGYVQILGGLQPGAQVVTTGSRMLSAELSEHLQEHVGENADAMRLFHHTHDDHHNAQK